MRIDSTVTGCILSYNSRNSLERTIAAVLEQTVCPGRLIIVDNHSSDGTSGFLEQLVGAWDHGTELRPVLLNDNLGVGAGHAVGWSLALADRACHFVWVLEHDCLPFPDCLETLTSTARTEPDLGAVVTRLSRNLDELAGDQATRPPPQGGSFTFNSVVLSRAAIERCGAPRTDLFCGQEDWEYSKAVREAGFRVAYPDAWALHATKGDTRYGVRPSVLRSYYSVRNSMQLDLEARGIAALPHIARRLVGGSILCLYRDRPIARHLAARWVAAFDALFGRLGRRSYSFLEVSSPPRRVRREALETSGAGPRR